MGGHSALSILFPGQRGWQPVETEHAQLKQPRGQAHSIGKHEERIVRHAQACKNVHTTISPTQVVVSKARQ